MPAVGVRRLPDRDSVVRARHVYNKPDPSLFYTTLLPPLLAFSIEDLTLRHTILAYDLGTWALLLQPSRVDFTIAQQGQRQAKVEYLDLPIGTLIGRAPQK